MASHSEPLNPDELGAPQQSGRPDASRPLSPPHHPHLPLPSPIRVMPAAVDCMAPIHAMGRSDDKITDNEGLVASFPLQPPNNAATKATKSSTNDTVARSDNNFGAAPRTTAAGPTVTQLLLPLMPAMIGPTEICSAEVWSKDPNFMIYCYKITPCTHSIPHDWRVCPWAHPNERAARRCPRMFLYASVPCANARSGRPCAKGPACEYSHNVTEYWLHPNRYCVEWCSLGLRCNRRLCFFAHSDAELRSPDASAIPTALPPPPPATSKQQNTTQRSCPDLRARSAASAGRLDVRALPAEQHPHQQQQQHLHNQQPSSFNPGSLGASASTDDGRQHDILHLLMTAAAAPAAPVIVTTQPHAASATDSEVMHRRPHQQTQQRQMPVSAVPTFCDLLGSVAPPPPAATQFAPTSTSAPPTYVLDASSDELIAAILSSLSTV